LTRPGEAVVLLVDEVQSVLTAIWSRQLAEPFPPLTAVAFVIQLIEVWEPFAWCQNARLQRLVVVAPSVDDVEHAHGCEPHSGYLAIVEQPTGIQVLELSALDDTARHVDVLSAFDFTREIVEARRVRQRSLPFSSLHWS
jgi:hypothetical protein